jgi:hypothetical protein
MGYLSALDDLWSEKKRNVVVMHPHPRGMLCRPLSNGGIDRVALIMPVTLPN